VRVIPVGSTAFCNCGVSQGSFPTDKRRQKEPLRRWEENSIQLALFDLLLIKYMPAQKEKTIFYSLLSTEKFLPKDHTRSSRKRFESFVKKNIANVDKKFN